MHRHLLLARSHGFFKPDGNFILRFEEDSEHQKAGVVQQQVDEQNNGGPMEELLALPRRFPCPYGTIPTPDNQQENPEQKEERDFAVNAVHIVQGMVNRQE